MCVLNLAATQSHIKVKNNIEINLAESSSSGVAAGAQDLIRQVQTSKCNGMV
jgi:hypothetical protein